MPTGYTATLMEKGQSFKEFATNCARAFGALIELRDEPFNAPIPEVIEDIMSDHYRKSLVANEKELVKLLNMTEAEQIAFGKEQKKMKIASSEKYLANARLENNRLDEMTAKVQAWQPPTKDHEEMKKFMLEQLEISKNSTSFTENELEKEKAKDPIAYYMETIDSINWGMEFDQKHLLAATKRNQEKNEWLQQLRQSLKEYNDQPTTSAK